MKKLELLSFLILTAHSLFPAAQRTFGAGVPRKKMDRVREESLHYAQAMVQAGVPVEKILFTNLCNETITILPFSVQSKNPELRKWALGLPGVDVDKMVNGVDPDGNSSLFVAAACQDGEAALEFLSLNANPNQANKLGMTPLDEAAVSGNAALVDAMLPTATSENITHAIKSANRFSNTKSAIRHLTKELNRRSPQPQPTVNDVKSALDHVQKKVQLQEKDHGSTSTSDNKPVSKSKSAQRNMRRRLKAKENKNANVADNNSSSQEESAALEQESSDPKQGEQPAPEQEKPDNTNVADNNSSSQEESAAAKQQPAAAHKAVPSHPIISNDSEKTRLEEARKGIKREQLSAEDAAILQASRAQLSRMERMKLHELTQKPAPAPVIVPLPIAAPIPLTVPTAEAHRILAALKPSRNSSAPSQSPQTWEYIPKDSDVLPPQCRKKLSKSEEEMMERFRRHVPTRPLPEKVDEKDSDEKSSSDTEDIAPTYPKSVTFEFSDGSNVDVNTHHAIVGDHGGGKHFLQENDRRKILRTSPDGIVEVERPAGGKTTCYTRSADEIIPKIPEDFNADLSDFREQPDGRLVFTTTREASLPGEDPRRPKHTRFVVDPATGKMGFFPVLND